MRILIDCDVLLNVLLKRKSHYEGSAAVLNWAESHPGRTAVAWHTVSNLEYLIKGGVRPFVNELLKFVEIPRTGTHEMRSALLLKMKNFEDAMQVAAAERFGAQIIVTRNTKDYANSPIKALRPADLMPLLTP